MTSLGVIAGCAGPAPKPASQEQQAAVEAILAGTEESSYGKSVKCISTHLYDSIDILNERLLVFRGRDRIWLNQLASSCPGLRRNDVLQLELHDNRACNLDTITVVDRLFLVWRRTGPSCMLGEFEPISEDQLRAIQAALGRAD